MADQAKSKAESTACTGGALVLALVCSTTFKAEKNILSTVMHSKVHPGKQGMIECEAEYIERISTRS